MTESECKRQPIFEKIHNPYSSVIKNVIAVMSGKGGVGKSSAAALLAAGLTKKGFKVGVLNAGIIGPSIPKVFAELLIQL
jgi:Mrp family chromosome partitioning ATPase